MIKRLIAAVLLLVPAAASAQSVIDPRPGRLEILGTARPACVMGSPGTAVGTNMAFEPASAGSGQLRIVDFVDGNAVSRGGSIEILFPMICNSAHRVVVRSGAGALRRLGAAVQPGPFAEFHAYRLRSQWGGQEADAESSAGPLVIDSGEARAGQMTLSVELPAGGRPLVAGPYADEIIVELQAAF